MCENKHIFLISHKQIKSFSYHPNFFCIPNRSQRQHKKEKNVKCIETPQSVHNSCRDNNHVFALRLFEFYFSSGLIAARRSRICRICTHTLFLDFSRVRRATMWWQWRLNIFGWKWNAALVLVFSWNIHRNGEYVKLLITLIFQTVFFLVRVKTDLWTAIAIFKIKLSFFYLPPPVRRILNSHPFMRNLFYSFVSYAVSFSGHSLARSTQRALYLDKFAFNIFRSYFNYSLPWISGSCLYLGQ